MDLLFVSGSFENFNWLAAFVVQPPLFDAICIFNRRAIDPMTIVVQIPKFGAVCIFNRRTIDTMILTVQRPIFVGSVASGSTN